MLKGEINGLTRSVDQLGAKVDMVFAMQVQLGRLQEQQDQSKVEIGRAFSAIHDNMTLSKQTESRVSQAISFVRGAMLVGAVLFAFAQWYTMGKLDAIDAATEKLAVIDRRLGWIEAEAGRIPVLEGYK